MLGAILSLQPTGANPAHPNIVIILADDLGYGDVHCYNPHAGKIPTPHLDRLASQGIQFTDAHSSSAVCSPSRYTLLTGRYHWRTRLQRGIVDVFGPPLIPAERLTIGSLAKQRGYRTAAIGKWHLGWDWPIAPEQRSLFRAPKPRPEQPTPVPTAHQRAVWREVFSKPILNGPITRGFDVYFGTDVPNWPPFCFIEQDRTAGIPSEFLPSENFASNLASIQGPALPGWRLEEVLPTLAKRAAVFIAECAQRSEPFLLYLALTSPHTPLAVVTEWKNRSGLNAYADFVMQTDATVGYIMDVLDRYDLAHRTLVLFTSDNGCAHYIGAKDLERMGHYPSGPLRGYKSDAWEGGHRVPFIVRWPEVVRPGRVCHQLVHQADVLRTIAEILGTHLPDHAGEDSVSFLPLLRGEDRPIRSHAVSTSIHGVPAVRLGLWKYIPAPGSGGWSAGADPTQPVQLYNLAEDLAETNNLAASQPAKVAELASLLETLIIQGRSTPGAPQTNDCPVVRYRPKRMESALGTPQPAKVETRP